MKARRSAAHTIIGLTGSSGSGKSEAAKILAGLGAGVIDADAISRAVVNEKDALAELVAEFGGWILDSGGLFDRALVSKRAFADGEFLARLTAVTHKYIIREIYERVDSLISDTGARAARTIIIDAPLPVKKGFLDLADEVWVVKSPMETRLKRVQARDGIAREAAEARFLSQMPDSEYEALADVVIDNSGDLCDLENELSRLYSFLNSKT